MPIGIFPRTANSGNVGEPGGLGGDLFEFFAIAEFVGVARTLDAKEAMLAWHRRAALLPVLIYGAGVADIGGDAGDRCEEEMILAAAAEIEGEAALSEATEEQRGAGVHGVKERRKFPPGYSFDEKFQDWLIRRRADGISALNGLFVELNAEGCVLPGQEGEGRTGVDFQDEKILCDFAAFEDAGGKKFSGIGDQARPPVNRMRSASKRYGGYLLLSQGWEERNLRRRIERNGTEVTRGHSWSVSPRSSASISGTSVL